MTDQYRIIGQLEAQQAALDEKIDRVDEKVDRVEAKIDKVISYIEQQKGGAKLIWAIAGAGGIIGVAVTKLGAAFLGLLGRP